MTGGCEQRRAACTLNVFQAITDAPPFKFGRVFCSLAKRGLGSDSFATRKGFGKLELEHIALSFRYETLVLSLRCSSHPSLGYNVLELASFVTLEHIFWEGLMPLFVFRSLYLHLCSADPGSSRCRS
jgi:hypothetical protein